MSEQKCAWCERFRRVQWGPHCLTVLNVLAEDKGWVVIQPHNGAML